MIEAGLEALQNLADPGLMAWLGAGVLIGITIGIIPGLGGMVGMAILLPFVFGMDPIAGIFLLLGMAAVTQTSDAFPAVLFGIPGTTASQATIMDGYPLAQKGEAGRALGAAFGASAIGGIIGAAALFAVLPIARPLVLALGSPELFMLALVGLATVGIVSQGSPILGVLSGVIGLLLAGVGTATTVLEYRYTFDVLVLRDGLSLVIIALGLFAIPEAIQLLTQNRAVAKDGLKETAGLSAGLRDVYRHRGLVVRSAGIGSVLGMVPGVGGSIIDWITYGLASRSKRNQVPFGEGEIRGVIAPESANNAKEGGTLVPTFLFGIPGSGTTAVLLGGLVLMGVQTGPRMVEGDGLVLILSVVFALVLANLLATTLCMGLSRWLAKISLVPAKILVPFILIVITIASYQDGERWGNILLFLGMGLLGWIMLTLKIPRPPLLIGFVLGPSVERYMWISISRYGADWLLFPGVITIGLVLVLVLVLGVLNQRRKTAPTLAAGASGETDAGSATSEDRDARPGREGE